MKILSVIPLKKSILKGNLTYFSSLDIPVGSIVSVPLRNKKTLGLVVATEDLSQEKSNVKKMNFNLKKETKNIKAEKLLFQYPFEERMSIYKTLIRESFAKRKSVFIVLPTEIDIE